MDAKKILTSQWLYVVVAAAIATLFSPGTALAQSFHQSPLVLVGIVAFAATAWGLQKGAATALLVYLFSLPLMGYSTQGLVSFFTGTVLLSLLVGYFAQKYTQWNSDLVMNLLKVTGIVAAATMVCQSLCTVLTFTVFMDNHFPHPEELGRILLLALANGIVAGLIASALMSVYVAVHNPHKA